MKKIITLFIFITALHLSGQVQCRFYNFGNVQIHDTGKVGFHADIINDGTFDQNQGEAGFYNENEAITISGSNSPIFHDMVTDVPNDLFLEVAVGVTNFNEFRDGRIITPRNNPSVSLNLFNDAPYLGSSDDAHVDGYVTNSGTMDFTFPIGDDFRIRPLSIDEFASGNTTRSAYFFENPSIPSTFTTAFDTSQYQATLSVISPVEFWDLDGDTETSVTLTWDEQSNIPFLTDDLENLRVVGWSTFEEKWVDLGSVNFSGDKTSGTITSELIIPNDYEALTIGSILKGGDDVFVYTGVSPNGDGKNDFLVIRGIESNPDNEMTIFNRWGVIVYNKRNYKNIPEEAWKGESQGRVTVKKDDLLPVGTYFYVLKLKNKKDLSGYIYLQR